MSAMLCDSVSGHHDHYIREWRRSKPPFMNSDDGKPLENPDALLRENHTLQPPAEDCHKPKINPTHGLDDPLHIRVFTPKRRE